MADSINPNANTNGSANFLPRFYRTDANKKFLQSTLDQLIQPGTVKKVNGFVGRKNAKATTSADIFVDATDANRKNYQLEPGIVINDSLDNVTFFKDYIDYINQLGVFGANTSNHARINEQEFYSWDPHIDWDKFVNFQNYYWLPYGPDVISIAGQAEEVISTYTITLEAEGDNNAYVFNPTGLVRNPTIKLYRGQTYKFEINSLGNPFSIKTARSSGPFDRYSTYGLEGNGVEVGTITFTVPFASPDVLYYQSESEVDTGGVFQILSIDENTVIDIDLELLGKKTYTLSDGTQLSNGMKVSFIGNVTPASYALGRYYVEGVGSSIRLVNEEVLELVGPYSTSESILFDSVPFDKQPFSDATSYAGSLDYIVINRASNDRNPWSRYNRWFHKDAVEASSIFNGKVPELDQANRAVRPIIEFDADLKLFNFGTTALSDIDLIDTYTVDVFSTIEGSSGYNVDGIPLAQGQRVLFTADTDILVKNKVYRVEFIDVLHLNEGSRQIHLVEEYVPLLNQVALIHQGVLNKGQMYWYDGSSWLRGQQKTELNQPPLFDIVDSNGYSYGDTSVYEGTTFVGTKLFSYKVGTGTADANLGFALSYKNISNIGDIVFNFNLVTDQFQYRQIANVITSNINVGYLVKTDTSGKLFYVNGWQKNNANTIQAAVRIYNGSNLVNNFDIDLFDDKNNLDDLVVRVYVNGIRLSSSSWTVTDSPTYKKIVLNTSISTNDVLTIRAFAAQSINANGYYEVPINLQNNPLNNEMSDFTLGEVIDHVDSIVDNLSIFTGTFPGPGNLRDLGNVTQYGTKFVQHSGPLSLSMYHVTSETNNIIRAIEQSRDDYGKFKRTVVTIAESLGVDTDTVAQLNLILKTINSDKPNSFPYYFSDMVPCGSSIRTDLTVVDYRIKTYPLTSQFSLSVLSNKAVGVYLNNNQLLVDKEYTFNSQGFVEIKATIATDDIITIYEYDNTDGCFVPETPTKLGLWPKFEPKIYVDTSYVTPRKMIQGHDGSTVLAYSEIGAPDDFRDVLILELEKRIYNNIKVSYDADIFDIYDVIPSYNRTNTYSLSEFNEVLAPSFYKWTLLVDRDFTKPLSYDRDNTFTYNYRGHIAPDGREVPGYWRGIYRWLLDTDRPHLCPWEMLGFTEEPAWWSTQYGSLPYTSDNLVMWQDIADGIVRDPATVPVKRDKFAKPFLMQCLPVDSIGNLISPLDSDLASGTITSQVEGDLIFGDVSPVEAAWRKSSFYPFSVILASINLAPAKTFGLLLDRSRVKRNIANQIVYTPTGLRIRPTDIVLPSIYSSSTRVLTSGIINYLVNYILSDNLRSYTEYVYDLTNMTCQLSHRLGAFTSKEKFNLILDSKTPLSSNAVFVPKEDYSIILNSSSPVKKITYSGVIITKLSDGFEVKGYSRSQPYFKYYPWIQSGPTVNVGGISESYTIWTANQQNAVGKILSYNGKYYRVLSLHTTTTEFEPQYYQGLAVLPILGGRDAVFRRLWDREDAITVPYGTKFKLVQDVVDFLTGYGEYLKDEGFIFDDFNNTLAQVTNWETSAKEFMFWTTQNWSTGEDKWEEWLPNVEIKFESIVRYNGDYYRAVRNVEPSLTFDADNFNKLPGLSTVGSSVISLSPAAAKLTFVAPYCVVDDIRNQFNGYEIFKVDGTAITPNFLNSFREDNAVSYQPAGQDGIYGASFYLVQKEQVVILNSTTMFNDTIYNPESGYQQERIKVAGYVSTNWNGSFNAAGFIFDQAKIADWDAWTDYALGDIVKYKEFYYSASTFLPGTETFVSTSWIKLDSKPTPKLLPNWTYKASQFNDFYSLDSDNFDVNQQKMAQHLIGYQKRQYLENIIQDDVSEFKFYQGMIIEKGTQNVLNKLFDVLSAEGEESLKFYEEWALRVGQYGANGAYENIEFILDEAEFKNNPQGFELVKTIDPNNIDFISRQTPNDVYLKPLGYNSSPWPIAKSTTSYLRTPGYVRPNEVLLTLATLDEILTADISTFNNGDCVWCTFEGPTWNVYKYTNSNINVTDIAYSPSEKLLTITAAELINIPVGTYIGISNAPTINGFYKIETVILNKITVTATIAGFESPFNYLDSISVYKLISQRAPSIDDINGILPSKLIPGELIWVDKNKNNKWSALEYNPAYTKDELVPSTPKDNFGYGRAIALNKSGNLAAISAESGEIVTYDRAGLATGWIQRQTLATPFVSINNSNNDALLSSVIAMSTDGTWLAAGSPLVGNIASNFVGTFVLSNTYAAGKIVNYQTLYYEALLSTTNHPVANTTYWKEVPYISVDANGTNSSLVEQGVVSLYRKDSDNIYILVDTILSPAPENNEKFGASLAFGENTLFVGSIGHNSRTGCVYKLEYSATVKASTAYNPNGSLDRILAVTTTAGIETGMALQGTGFTSGQYVTYVHPDGVTLTISSAPDATPDGVIKFTLTYWKYAPDGRTVGLAPNTHYGFSLALSNDSSILVVGAPDTSTGGAVFVYELDGSSYTLLQTLSTTDEKFGKSISVSNSGLYLAISNVLADDTKLDQGSVLVYKFNGTNYSSYQVIESTSPEIAGQFGSKVAFMNDYDTLVIYSINGDTQTTTTFDNASTTFDNEGTAIVTKHTDSGRIDVYDRYSTKWVFSESLLTDNEVADGFGQGLAVGADQIFVGTPYATDRDVISGKVYKYSKPVNTYSWVPINFETDKPDPHKIKRAFLYNKKTNKLIQYIDVIDPTQNKIAGIADKEIKYKTFYDPAVYSTGTASVTIDDGIAWTKNQVGTLWWDLRNAKFIDSYDSDIVYRNSTWNTLAVGASIDIYEWVQSTLLPAEWDKQADTEAGIASGISGTTLYGNTAYSINRRYDNVSKSFKNTYYYWVKNKKTVPNISTRTTSAQDVADLIANPRGEGYIYLALTGLNSFSLINAKPLLDDKDVVLSVEYWTIDNIEKTIHTQWKIISEDVSTELPIAIEQKWFDSLCGKDTFGRLVPDTALPLKLRYGVENRPRQGMFVNRFEALKQFVEQTNLFLIANQIVLKRNISGLESYDAEPSTVTSLYDIVLDTDVELRFAPVGSFQRPSLLPTIVDGKITGITIVSRGNGYINAPFITVHGTGVGAKIKTTINNKGQITGAEIISSGYGYDNSTMLFVRDYAVLVHSDSQSNNVWSIYSYDPDGQVWSRTQSQVYDTRNYWNYVDWYATGYTQFTASNYAVDTFSELSSIDTSINDIVKIRTDNSGNWLLLEKYSNSTSIDWTQSYKVVGSQNGTIQLSSSLYTFTGTSVGYDGSLYDGGIFDNVASSELRIILNVLKDNIFIDDLKSQFLHLFFTCVRYALSEQQYLDWIFKTSFVKSKHNVGELHQPVNYQNDNLSNFEDYVSEVKPYRTKVREYISAYTKVESAQLSVTDFDLPSVYENGKLSVINTIVSDGKIIADNPLVLSYPWKHWADNIGFTITALTLVDSGGPYLTEPVVRIISESGTGATARAFISNGKVNRIVLLKPGTGYLSAPTVIIDGGLSTTGVAARAVAIIGDSKIRSNLIKMKFDRISQTYFITQLQETETFTGTGSRVQFQLKWAPDARIGQSTVTIDGLEALRSNYKLTITKSTTRGYTSYSGVITFDTAPAKLAAISVTYLKDWSLLNAADRIQYYYNPQTGDLGKDLAQLMTGIDYGGVIISGLGFEVGSGWGSLPYYSDKWDTFDATFDDYITTVSAGTHEFTLPYTPTAGTEINAYQVVLKTQEYLSDGITLNYSYDFLIDNPVASVKRTVATNGIEAYYNPVGSSGTTLVVTDTTGIEVGMNIINDSFVSGQTVTNVNIDGVTLTLSAVPNTTPNDITPIIFTKNIAGKSVLNVVDTMGIEVGDIVTCATVSGAFGYETKVTEILNDTAVQLDQILFADIVDNVDIVFAHKLIVPTDVTIYANGTFLLTTPVPIDSYIYIIGTLPPVRIAQDLISNDGIANGSSSTFIIDSSIIVNDGDQIILRKSSSDGSIKPQDADYDTALTGGNLAYTSATGLAAEDILVDGDGFVTPTSSPATEEVVPGQVVDAVAIKIYDKPNSGSANIKVDSYVADGIRTSFPITQTPNSNQAVIVKITDGLRVGNTVSSTSDVKTIGEDYTLDYKNKLINFDIAPADKKLVSIFSFGFSGSNILDLDYFVGNGVDIEFVTRAPWLTPVTALVYVNGIPEDAELFKTDATYDAANRIGIRLGVPPVAGALINFIIVSGDEQTFAVTKIERIPTDGSLTYDLAYKIGDSLPIESSMIVRVDQEILKGPNNSYFTIGSNRLNYTLDPAKFLPYSADVNTFSVLADGNLLTVGTDYILDLSGITIKLNRSTYKTYTGKSLIVSISAGQGYTYVPATQQIIFAEAYDNTHIVEVISSYKHDILDIQRTAVNVTSSLALTPNTVEYYNYTSVVAGKLLLDRPVIDDNYVWVLKNGTLLTPSVDYKLLLDRKSIKLTYSPLIDDEFALITYGSNILTTGIAYMQFKDMLNRVHFKRLSLNKQTLLTADLKYNDTVIEVADSTNFDAPNPAKNKPGVIEIRGERIEFFAIDGNTLRQLRRGTLGTGTPTVHKAGAYVQEIGSSETIPYSEIATIEQVISDGTNIVPLTITPSKATTTWSYDSGFVSSIPSEYGQSNDIEVFVGGYASVPWASSATYAVDDIVEVGSYTYRCIAGHTSSAIFTTDSAKWEFFVGNIRLKKQPYKVHNVSQHSESPEGDVQLDAEFAVDGVSNELRLTHKLAFGTRVTVVKRVGQRWDDTVNIQNSDSKIARFLKATPGIWYSEIKQDTVVNTWDSLARTFDNTNSSFDQG